MKRLRTEFKLVRLVALGRELINLPGKTRRRESALPPKETSHCVAAKRREGPNKRHRKFVIALSSVLGAETAAAEDEDHVGCWPCSSESFRRRHSRILSVNRISLRCPATVPRFAIAVSRAIVSPWSKSS
jgi:hypothetical protein